MSKLKAERSIAVSYNKINLKSPLIQKTDFNIDIKKSFQTLLDQTFPIDKLSRTEETHRVQKNYASINIYPHCRATSGNCLS